MTKPPIPFYKIEEEYRPDILNDNEELHLLKEKIFNLSEADKTLILTYIDTGTYSETGKILHISSFCARENIKRIKKLLTSK